MAGFGRAQHPDRDASDGDAMFRAAFETAGHGMAIVGLDGRFLEANDACASIIGYSPPELQQLDVQSVTHPDDRGDELAQMQRLLEGEAQSYQMERRYIHKAGHSVWARLNVALIRDASNEPIYFVSQLQDITQGMHAREALRESELRFRTSLANLPGIVFRWRLAADGSIRDTYVSPHVADLLGIPPEMMARHGLRIMDFIHAEDRPRLVQELDRGARRLTASSIEVRGVTRPGGEMRWLQMHMTPRRAKDGSVEFDGIALDITQHRKLQDQLRLRERALDSISQAITIADASRPEYPIIDVNPAFERMTGYTPAEVIGHDYRFLEGPATDPEKLARKRAEMRSGRAFQGELVNHRKDGTAFVNEISITPVSDALGRLTHFVAVMNDVTTRHNLEAQLRQAVKIEAVGKLTGGVAHDFNNLLMVAHRNLELLSEALTAGESQVGELVDQAQKAILRGAELTRRLLAFARLQPLRAVSVDLNQLIVELVPLLSRTLGEDRDGAGREPVDGDDRLQPGGERPAQPGGQCPRCHAARRPADDRHRQRPPRAQWRRRSAGG